MGIKKTITSIHPLFFVAIAILVLSYFILASNGLVDDNIRMLYVVLGAIIIILAFSNMEKRLLTIAEAQDIAYADAKQMQNKGKIREDGRLLVLEDGVLKRVNGEPDSLNVAVGITGIEPVVLVYAIQPYTGYILRMSKREYWDARKDPDLKIIVPPGWIEFLEAKRNLYTDVDMV
jgi:hypothetical protein